MAGSLEGEPAIPFTEGSTKGEGMIEVQVGDAERIEDSLKKFRRKVQRAGLLKELRRRREYLKPSVERQRKAAAARRRGRRRDRPE